MNRFSYSVSKKHLCVYLVLCVSLGPWPRMIQGSNVLDAENTTLKSENELLQDAIGESETLRQSGNANLTRCSKTELSLAKESLIYHWDLKGFLNYYSFMKSFGQLFELKTEEVSFKSDIVDGKWHFKITKVSTSTTGPGGIIITNEDLVVSSTYSYDAKQPRKLHIHIQPLLLLSNNEKEIILPVQKSANPIVMQQRLYNRRGYSSYSEYVHSFVWPNVASAIENILKDQIVSSDAGKDKYLMYDDNVVIRENQDVSLKFMISVYLSDEPVYTGLGNCQSIYQSSENEGLVKDARSKSCGWSNSFPPYLKQSSSMLHDDRFADVSIKVGDRVFSAHGIILSASSPVFSEMLENVTAGSTSNDVLMDDQFHINNDNNNKNKLITEIVIPENKDMNENIMSELLRYIYTGRVTLLSMAEELILAAHKYELNELTKMCERHLLAKINSQNAIQMYEIGHHVNSPKLHRRAFSIMKANKSKLVTQAEDFQRLSAKHPALLFELFVSS